MLDFLLVEIVGMIRSVQVIGVVEIVRLDGVLEHVINTHKYLIILKTPLLSGVFCF